MTTTTLSPTERTRLSIQLDTSPGIPKLPHIPESLYKVLTPEQREANLLHVALWIVERDQGNFNMGSWHQVWGSYHHVLSEDILGEKALAECGTVHCIAGFSQVMAGKVGFSHNPWVVGKALLGKEASNHFHDSNEDGLAFLKEIIARNS